MKIFVDVNAASGGDGTARRPFATPQEALAFAARQAEDVYVTFRSGTYAVSSTLAIGKTAHALTLAGEGEVVFDAGLALSEKDFAPLSPDDALFDIPAAKRILVCDLSGKVPDDFGKQVIVGSHTASKFFPEYAGVLPCEVYLDGEHLPLVGYPKEKSLGVEKITEEATEFCSVDAAPAEEIREKPFGAFALDGKTAERAALWRHMSDLWIDGALCYDWAPEKVPCTLREDGTVAFRAGLLYGLKKTNETRFRIVNLPDAFSDAEEYYIDKKTKKLYISTKKKHFSLHVSVSAFPIVDSTADRLTLKNVSFTGTRATGFVGKGRENLIENCRFFCLSGYGVEFEGSDSAVRSCTFSRLGSGGVKVSGGDRATLTPANITVEDCLVEKVAQVVTTYHAGVRVEKSVGVRVAHNRFHNMPHTAILYFHSNDITIEYNDLDDVCNRSIDAGAIYTGRDFLGAGNVVRYNFIHNIRVRNQHSEGPVGIYLDDGSSGSAIVGNIIDGIPDGKGILWAGGRDVHVENNLILHTRTPIYVDNRDLIGYETLHGITAAWGTTGDFWAQMLKNEKAEPLVTLTRYPYKSEVWQKKYPAMRTLAAPDPTNYKSGKSPLVPGHSTLKNNIVSWSETSDPFGSEAQTHGATVTEVGFFLWGAERYIKIGDNYGAPARGKEATAVPHDETYRIPADAEAFRHVPHFHNIPFSEIGIGKKN